MEKQFKIGEKTIMVKGLKAEIEKITEPIKKLVGIKSYMIEKNGIIGGEERETLLMVMFGQNALRNPEEFETKKAEFLSWVSNRVLTMADYQEINSRAKEIFDAHVHINDQRLTPEQKEQQTIERNETAKIIEAKREQERIKTDQEKEALKKEYPYLMLMMDKSVSSRIMATRNIRKELDRAFPSLVFSITSETFSGGDSIDIRWTDGATPEEVNKIIRKYQEGHFNGMIDLYEYSDRAFCSLFGGAKYVHANRSITSYCFQKVAEKLGYGENFLMKDQNTWELVAIEDADKQREARNQITQEAYNTSFYVKPSQIEVSAEIERSSNGIRIQENKEHQGIEIVFDSKPSQDIIDRLKANRFRWNNRTKVWYSKMNSSSQAFANSFIKPSAEETPIEIFSAKDVVNTFNKVFNNPEQGLETESYQNFERELETESRMEREY